MKNKIITITLSIIFCLSIIKNVNAAGNKCDPSDPGYPKSSQCNGGSCILNTYVDYKSPNRDVVSDYFCEDVAVVTDVETLFRNIISISGVIAGFALFIMLIMGGSRYLLSGGDPKSVQAAQATITWAIVGLALFALSFTILLIIQTITGVQVTIFKIGV